MAETTTNTSSDPARDDAAAPEVPSATPRHTNRGNLELFKFTILMFTISARSTETLMEAILMELPLATKRLEMADRILPPGHSQRQRHMNAVAGIQIIGAVGKELLSAISRQRSEYNVNMPEYSTGLFAEYNQTSFARLLETVDVACAKAKDAYPKVVDYASIKRLVGMESHFERWSNTEREVEKGDKEFFETGARVVYNYN